MGVKASLTGYVELTRPHNLLATALTTLVGWLSVGIFSQQEILNPIYPLLTVCLVAAGGYVINDYFDAEVDSVNKPYRPIPSGRVSRRGAAVFSLLLAIIGVALSLTSGMLTFGFAVFNAALVFAYSYKIKEWGFIGNAVVAFQGAASIIYGALALAEYQGDVTLMKYSLIPALYAFLLLLAREIVKTIEDFEADSLRDVKSIPRVLGIPAAAKISALIIALVIAISPAPYLLTGYGYLYVALVIPTDIMLAYAIAVLIKLPSKKNPMERAGKLRSLLKVSIFLGILAFLLDLAARYLGLFPT